MRIEGLGGDDRLMGGTGNDTLIGGAGSDSFGFADGWGNDVIRDFANDGVEQIYFGDNTTINAMSDLTITYSGGNATITTADGSIILIGVASGLDAGDFTF